MLKYESLNVCEHLFFVVRTFVLLVLGVGIRCVLCVRHDAIAVEAEVMCEEEGPC